MLQGVIGAGLLLLASTGQAANGTKPRVPVDWTGTPCMTIVDRSANPILHIEYSVSQDDTDLTPDEVEDSRTHQFFAFCRAHNLQTFLPRWITQDDIDRAAAKGSAPAMINPEDVLDTSTVWEGCWYRINADDDRRPITMAAAAEGVDWDTSAVPAGSYTLEGYTFEPSFNLWSTSPGLIKVVDDPEPAASAPAIAIENTEELIYQNQSVTISGCVSAMEGTTLTAHWARAEPNLQWQVFVEDEPVAGTSFAVDLTPPEALAGESAMVRVEVTDPMGRSHTNYMRNFVIVLEGEDPSACADESGGDPGCGDSGEDTMGEPTTSGSAESDGGSSSGGSTGGSPEQGPSQQSEGCGCRSTGGAGPIAVCLVLLGMLGISRRRPALRRGR